MVVLRLRYENGHLIPLDPIPNLQNGDEIEVQYITPSTETRQNLEEMLATSAGTWGDEADLIESYIQQARQQWQELWQQKLDSL